MKKEDVLFNKGIEAFNNRKFYDAHEYWEELWLDYKLNDARFIQGLIQLAISYFHFFNQNLNGARSMLKKCLIKIDPIEVARGIDVIELKSQICNVQKYFDKIDNTNNITSSYIILLKVIHE
jgi:predicted metal-dependent hydrolase